MFAQVHAGIELHGVSIHDLNAMTHRNECLGDIEGQVRFAGAGWPDNGYESNVAVQEF